MRYVSVITDYAYLLWQTELQIFNLETLGILQDFHLVLLHEPGQALSPHAQRVMASCQSSAFPNTQIRRHYIPSNKPFGIARLLEKYPRLGRRILILDPDVVFRKPLDFTRLETEPCWYVSDSHVVTYIGWDYILGCLGPLNARLMADIVGISPILLAHKQRDSGGAQYYCKNLTAELCDRVARDSIRIYDFITQFKKPDGSHRIQVWTAEMWAWLWHGLLEADVRVHPELDFAWATHPAEDWQRCKMLHMAGVTGSEPGCFFKGKYAKKPPWEVEPNLDFVSRDKCWRVYADLIESYRKRPER